MRSCERHWSWSCHVSQVLSDCLTVQDRDLKLLQESHHVALKQCRQSRAREELLRLEAEHLEKVASPSPLF